jgi:hypothetical protein
MRHDVSEFRWKSGQSGNPKGRPRKIRVKRGRLQPIGVILDLRDKTVDAMLAKLEESAPPELIRAVEKLGMVLKADLTVGQCLAISTLFKSSMAMMRAQKRAACAQGAISGNSGERSTAAQS